MKYFFPLVVLLLLYSCDNSKSYYEQITEDKLLLERTKDLNKPIQEIRKKEKGKLIKEDIDYLEFEYKIGENDTYVISYLFDQKGAYEIGLDGYFTATEDAKQVLDEFTNELNLSDFNEPNNTPRLKRWLSKDESRTVELDYSDIKQGMIVVTIFANE